MMVRKQQGFTLVEMIIVIVISGILSSVMAVFIAQPIQGFIDLSRRATLVYSAENALRRMQRDIRRALPNSVRVSGNALELISTVEGARYRLQAGPASPLPTNRLEFNTADTDFDVLGNLSNLGSPSGLRVAIYNIGALDAGGLPVADSNAYAAGPSNVITPAGTTVNIINNVDEDHIEIVGGFQFSHESPSSRLYLVDNAVSYLCTGGQLRRYEYTNFANNNQPTTAAALDILDTRPAEDKLMADNVTACAFTYAPGTDQRAGVTTLDLTVSDIATGEQIRLLHQVHVDNAP